MRTRSSFALILLLALCTSAQARGPAVDLVKIEIDGASLRTLVAEVAVVREMQGYALAIASAEDVTRLRADGRSVAVLDENVAEKQYFVLTLANPGLLAKARAAGEVVHFDGVNAVAEITSERAIALATPGIEISRLFLEAISLPPEESRLRSLQSLAYDATVQAIVDSVSQANLETYVTDLVAFGTRRSDRPGGVAASNYLFAKYQSFGITDVQLHDFNSNADNVVATIPGSVFPDDVYVIGAHYDSTAGNPDNAPGADDDGSGTAAVLEIARILANHDLENTVVFVNFASEEFGLIGSSAYASLAAQNGMNILGMVNLDMIGYLEGGDDVDIDIVTNSSSTDLQALAGWATEQYVPALPWVNGSLPFGASSDHVSFWNRGFRAIMLFEDSQDHSPYIHTADDTIGLSLNDFPFATLCTKATIATIATLAQPVDDIAIGHSPLPDTSDDAAPYSVVAHVLSTHPLTAGSPALSYSTGGAFSDVVMTATGNPDEYAADIPAQPIDTTVRYYLAAADTQGGSEQLPEGGASSPLLFEVEGGSGCGGAVVSPTEARKLASHGLAALPVAMLWCLGAVRRRKRA